MPAPLSVASRRFRVPAEPFTVLTADGVRLAGSRLGRGAPALVLCHGFLGWHRKPSVGRFAEALAPWFTVYAFDLRGHGRSGGRCTFGDREVEDVSAVVELARSGGHELVAAVGASMGGIAVIRHAALRGGVDAVVAVSSPARWDGHRSRAIRRMVWFTVTAPGRLAIRGVGVRVDTSWRWPESPEDVVGKIAPTPLVLVHGLDDQFFDEEDAWRLYRRAGHPKRLILASPFGHAESGFSPALAERVARHLFSLWGIRWPG